MNEIKSSILPDVVRTLEHSNIVAMNVSEQDEKVFRFRLWLLAVMDQVTQVIFCLMSYDSGTEICTI